MENWDKVKKNVNIAETSSGTLNEQSERYAEGWEAARKRVKASMESLYSTLVDEKFFIGLLNGLEKVLKTVDMLMDSMGGLKGVLSTIGVLLTRTFSK
jgi:hypothetical protein